MATVRGASERLAADLRVPYCGHHRLQHAPEWDGQDCFWICSMVEPERPCLCSVLCLEGCGQRHEHG
jgi:hypothetical protein